MSKKDDKKGIIKLVRTGQDEMEDILEEINDELEKENIVGFIFGAKMKDGSILTGDAGDLTMFESMALCSYLQSKANYNTLAIETTRTLMDDYNDFDNDED